MVNWQFGREQLLLLLIPHEMANVMGVEGIEFMINNSMDAKIKVYYTIPSCVPATSFDISGGTIASKDVEKLAVSGRFVGLSEVMNVPGVPGWGRRGYAKACYC
ncbi:hypothetical protein NXV14_19160 [Bacteroides fragilis]|nr:hypothetical protein [Bacteroides fragilis]